MSYILNEQFNHLFTDKYPLFYKSKIQREGEGSFSYMNAIDNAIKHD